MIVEELIKELQEMVARGSVRETAEVVVDAYCGDDDDKDWYHGLNIEIDHSSSFYNRLILNAEQEEKE